MGHLRGTGSIPACAGEPDRERQRLDHARVHPRLRGGAEARHGVSRAHQGPSPPARGSRELIALVVELVRSIPACAGEPRCHRRAHADPRVHPRLRGGAGGTTAARRPATGPSPPARGSRDDAAEDRGRQRSIPACAGEPPARRFFLARVEVHPRLRGGAYSIMDARTEAKGPSPPARGSHRRSRLHAETVGSIPACAGEPRRHAGVVARRSVHPRLRGGADECLRVSRGPVGPSPPARGSRRETTMLTIKRGSIPACAGEPTRRAVTRASRRVHPRLRGGAGSSASPLICRMGPSPPARGSHALAPPRRAPHGSIPACAGEPTGRNSGCRCTGVHPRLRGGAGSRSDARRRPSGPSPPARGSPRPRRG